MARNPEVNSQKKRYLEIRYDPKGGSRWARSSDFIQHRLIPRVLNHAEIPNDTARVARLERSYHGRRRLRIGEAEAVATIMESMTNGTKLRYKRFTVVDVKEGKKAKVIPEYRSPFGLFWPGGWKNGFMLTRSVKHEHNKHMREAMRNLKRATHTRLVDRLTGKSTIKQTLDADEAFRDAIDEGRSKVFEWRASLVSKIVERNPLRAGKKAFKIGRTSEQLFNEIYSTLVRAADDNNLMDPADMIHGPLEKPLKEVQRFQTTKTGAVLGIFAGGQKILDTVNDAISIGVSGNKILSRDSIRHPRVLLRSLGGGALYEFFYNEVSRYWLGRTLFPPPSVLELTNDKRMDRQVVAKLKKLEGILTADLPDGLSKKHQIVVADAYIRASNAAAPRLEVFSEAIMDKFDGVIGKSKDIQDKIAENSLVSKLLRRGGKAPVRTETSDDPRAILKEASEAYGGEPKSVKAQADAILEYGDRVLASTALTKEERMRWERAVLEAKRLNGMYDQAVKITTLVA